MKRSYGLGGFLVSWETKYILRWSGMCHLGIIVATTTSATALGGAPNTIIGGTAAVLLAELYRWEEDVRIFRTWTTFEQALKK
jgi:hypothetical protein